MLKYFVMWILFIIFVSAVGITAARAEVFITVDKSQQMMYVDTPEESYVWKVSTAKDGYTTPVGQYQPYLLKKMHYSREYDNAPMPYSVFFYGGYAIHATSYVKQLGRPASHGCVRLSLQNARWLYRLVQENGKNNTYIQIVP